MIYSIEKHLFECRQRLLCSKGIHYWTLADRTFYRKNSRVVVKCKICGYKPYDKLHKFK